MNTKPVYRNQGNGTYTVELDGVVLGTVTKYTVRTPLLTNDCGRTYAYAYTHTTRWRRESTDKTISGGMWTTRTNAAESLIFRTTGEYSGA